MIIYKQVKHYRALHEQASTYLDLVCSVCDLSDESVRVSAAEVQQVKLTVSKSKYINAIQYIISMKKSFFITPVPTKNIVSLDRGKDVHCTRAVGGLERDQRTETRFKQPVPGHGAAAAQPL